MTDDNLVNYLLEIAPAAGGTLTIAEGDSSIANGKLGEFDPTTLQNDSYILRLEATDANGQTSSTERTVEVTGELKLGNFRLSFTDLEIPVAGIPISVTRTYDTLTAKSQDDFGYGWRLEFRDTDLRTSVKAPTEQQELLGIPAAFDDKTRVYVTLPGGKRTSFTFNPYGDRLNAFLGSGGSAARWYHPAFKSEDGSDVTLSVDDVRLVKGTDGKYYDLGGAAYNPENPRFGGSYTLTTKEGIEYKIDTVSGDLLTVTDTNGNTLTYSDSGITSDTGQSVTFERNAAGLIVAAVDPEGERIEYEYDDNGDLVAVRDKDGTTTSFEYETPERPHYLTQINDPLNRPQMRSQYDENGRLVQILDVDGEKIELSYDPDNSTQLVSDRLGSKTFYEYDSRGNVITEIASYGDLNAISRRTFNDRNQLLSITNPENETTTYNYDSNGNLSYITDPLGNTAYYTYNNVGQVSSRTDPLGNTIRYVYDEGRNLLNITNPEGFAFQETTDQFGQVNSIVDAHGNTTQFEYDSRGNVIREIDALGNETTYTYNNNGDQLTETVTIATADGTQQHTTSWTYDTEGRLLTKTDPVGNVIRHEYDTNGNLIALIESGMNERRTEAYEYDEKGQRVKTLYADGTSESYKYDREGRLIAETDRAGKTTHFTYNSLGQQIEIIYDDNTPDNLDDNPRIQSEYDLVGRLTARIDEQGNRTEYEYDRAGRLSQKIDALNNTITYTYDALGRRLTETDARHNTTRFVYDRVGRLIETHYADGTQTTVTYNEIGLKIAETDRAGQTTNFVYDELNRLIEIIHPDRSPENLADNPRTQTEYNEKGQVIAEINELGNRNEYEYDAAGRLIESRASCSCRRKTYTYDAAGNPLAETDPLNRTTQFVYDELNRPIEIHFADGTYETNTYDKLGRIIAQTDRAGQTTFFEYDRSDRLTAVIDAKAQRTEYEYDLVGNLIQIKDANQNITQYEYDSLNRRTATILPMGQREEITYDEVGNIASVTNFNGETISYQYDSLNRMVGKQLGDAPLPQVRYSYTPNGQIETITDYRGITRYQYDERERLLERIDPDGQFIRYSYDAAGNRTEVITPNGTTTYTYDRFNQLKTISDPNLAVTEYVYDRAGNIIQTKFPNEIVETREYDSLNRLTFLEHAQINPATGEEIAVISSYDYGLDAYGNRISVTENNGRAIEYDYDELYRLTREKITDPSTGVRTIDFTYDAIGNRLTRNDSIEGISTYTYNNNDWLLAEELNGQVTNYSYDDNGNLLGSIADANHQTTYNWDIENRLTQARITDSNGTVEAEYLYNSDGVRVASIIDSQETRYLIDANRPYAQVLEEYAPNGTVSASYVYGNDLISQQRNQQRSFYHVDGLGSTRVLTDVTGNITDTYHYEAYGTLLNATGNTLNHYLFAGEQYDPSLGDYYLRARYYNSDVGRFISRDPFEGFLTEPLSLAKYPYVHGNPVNAIDPSGLLQMTELSLAITTGAILAALHYTTSYMQVGTANTFDEDNVLVPGYLKEINHPGINKFLNQNIITSKNYQVVRKKVEQCNLGIGGENCDFSGFPVIVWGTDIPEITQHTQDAIIKTGQSFLAHISPGWDSISTGRIKKYADGRSFPAAWYDFTPECPWDNDRPMRYFHLRSGKDCDEYPYNSTLQSGLNNYQAGKVSLKLVDRHQNNQQGIFLGGVFDRKTKERISDGFYQFAPVPYNHPTESWFGVEITSATTYWIDRDGNPRDIVTGEVIPF